MDLDDHPVQVVLVIETTAQDAANIQHQIWKARRRKRQNLTDLHLDGRLVAAYLKFEPLTQLEMSHARTAHGGDPLRAGRDGDACPGEAED